MGMFHKWTLQTGVQDNPSLKEVAVGCFQNSCSKPNGPFEYMEPTKELESEERESKHSGVLHWGVYVGGEGVSSLS